MQAWRDLYASRRSWAINLTSHCTPIAKAVDQHNGRTDIIHRAVGVALENLKSHVGSLEHKFQEAQNWAHDLVKDQQTALDGWQHALSQLDGIPARQNLSVLRRPSTPKSYKDRPPETLKDYVDAQQIKDAASSVSTASQRFTKRTDELSKTVADIASETEALVEAAQPSAQGTGGDLIEELETITKKISSDYEHVLGLPDAAKTLSSVSRMALNHTKDLLPSMRELCHEMQTALDQSIKRQNSATISAVRHMHSISDIESRLASAQSDISKLDVDGAMYDTLCAVFHLPVVYGSVLIECVRRQEWSDKIKADSSSLAEELAVYRDEEQRRRKKWIRGMGDFLSLSDDSTPAVEINYQDGRGPDWPEVCRKDVETYLQDLESKEGLESAVEELKQLFKDLDTPTRQQKRRAKAFKHGSFVDMGRSSFLARGDEAVRSLKDEKTKLEDRLKGSESRVRKLEDLLHRQNQTSRPASAHFAGQDMPVSPTSPRPDTISRKSSGSSRRPSSNHPPEEKGLMQRMINLEAELIAEKETVAKLQREAHAERQTSVDKMEEIQSTKKDLIENLEAQQREFGDERKLLESETKNMKIKLEELEEELDRVIDNQDQERQDADGKTNLLQTELDNIKKEHDDEKASLNAQITENQAQCTELVSKNSELQEKTQEIENGQQESKLVLQAAHAQLSPEGAPPVDFRALVNAIEVLSEGLAIHAKQADETSAQVTDENKSLTEKVNALESETESLRQELDGARPEKSKVQEELESERSNISALQLELDSERNELKVLRTKSTTDGSGAELLKNRIAEEEQKVNTLTEKLTTADSRAQEHNDELSSWRRKAESLEEAAGRSSSHYEARGARADSISRKLYSHIEQLCRVLEQLGFTIVFQEDQMTIQRTSKVSSSSALGESLVSSDFPSMMQDSTLPLWIQTDDPDEEASKYAAFINAVGKFDIEAFGEVVVKRVKDIEALARKWQKEARGYRDKYHRAQSDAHDKISYRSFKDGDLALFLPTRNQNMRSWAAFNVGAPHYFLREQDAHKLNNRDWLVARISKMEERVVDLSKSMNGGGGNQDLRSVDANDEASVDDDNPFDLSDGLRWYLLDAVEEKPGAPSTPGLGKSTVASAHVDAKGSIRLKRAPDAGAATRTLTRSLDSRRDSSTSKKSVPPPTLQPAESSGAGGGVVTSEGETAGGQPRREQAPLFDQVRKDLLLESPDQS